MERINLVDFNNLLSSSSDSDDEIRRPRIMKHRNNLMNELDDVDFKKRFRMKKDTVESISNMLHGLFEPVDRLNNPISKLNQILICLRFYATGSFQINIGDHFNVSQSTVSRIVRKVTRDIVRLRPNFIKMPETDEEKRRTILGFYQIANFPGVIGAVDCTHIKIKSPGGNQAEVFRNRKGYFSINVQAVCNSNLKITDIVSRWPGSVHDTTIFNDSNIRARFEGGEFVPYYLVGDGGYPCRTYLLTPLGEILTVAQQRYNFSQIRTRNPVERLFGVLKRRFPCLSVGMSLSTEVICEVIVATAVLHNICLEEQDDMEDIVDENNDNEANYVDVVHHYNRNEENYTVRNSLINTIFQ